MISWPDCVRNEEVLRRVNEEMNVLQTTERRESNWFGHILHRNCLLRHVIERKIEGRLEVMGRRGKNRKQLPDDRITRRYCKFVRRSTRSYSVQKRFRRA
jgi:hypothetical protein